MAVITPDTDLYTELYDYILDSFDARPSIAKTVIASLPGLMEKKIKELEESKVTIQVGPISPIPEDFGPVPKTIHTLY